MPRISLTSEFLAIVVLMCLDPFGKLCKHHFLILIPLV